jgi:ABC-type multidrug transport system ATPase subunit
MLTGMVAPTDGYAFVDGKDIRSEMTKIRQETGICLQHVSGNICISSPRIDHLFFLR